MRCFFFQAEDGIRDLTVTGVQTCALPIFGAWIMQRIDVAVRGRVASVLMLASYGITPISLAVAGFLVAWSLKLMFLLAGGLMVLAAAGAAFQKQVRQIE